MSSILRDKSPALPSVARPWSSHWGGSLGRRARRRVGGANRSSGRSSSTKHAGCEVRGGRGEAERGREILQGALRRFIVSRRCDATAGPLRLFPFIFFHFHLLCTTGAGGWILQQATDVKAQASLHVSCTCLHFRATNTPKVHGCITGLQKKQHWDTILVTSHLNLLPYSTT